MAYFNANQFNPLALQGLMQAPQPAEPGSVQASRENLDDPERLQKVMERWQAFPGSAPGGTGTTGLAANDIDGYVKHQNENVWAMNALRALQGQGPMNVRFGGNAPTMRDAPSAALDEKFYRSAPTAGAARSMPGYESHDDWLNRIQKSIYGGTAGNPTGTYGAS